MTDKTNGGSAPNPPSPEYQVFLDDLKQYDNPEVFEDPTLPQHYKLRVITKNLPEHPTILDIEVDGEALFRALRETMFKILQLNPNLEETIRQFHGDIGWDEARTKLLADEEYLESEQEMFWFFVRYLPKFMVNTYNIAAMVSAMSTLGRLLDEPEEINEREKIYRTILNDLIRGFKKDIKQMLATRSSGRPKKYGTGKMPEIVRRVVFTARGMMGEERGKDAVPVLKGIAFNLDLTENALRKQLVRAGYPWADIRDWLAQQP